MPMSGQNFVSLSVPSHQTPDPKRHRSIGGEQLGKPRIYSASSYLNVSRIRDPEATNFCSGSAQSLLALSKPLCLATLYREILSDNNIWGRRGSLNSDLEVVAQKSAAFFFGGCTQASIRISEI